MTMRRIILDDIVSLPLSVSEAKDHLRVTHGDADTEIASMIRAAVAFAESFTHQVFVERNFDYSLGAFPGSGPLWIPVTPVRSIDQVAYVDPDGNNGTFSDYDEVIDNYQAQLCPKAGASWPRTRVQALAVEIKGVAGHPVIPDAAKHAIKLMVGDAYKHRESVATRKNDSALNLLRTLKVSYTLDDRR